MSCGRSVGRAGPSGLIYTRGSEVAGHRMRRYGRPCGAGAPRLIFRGEMSPSRERTASRSTLHCTPRNTERTTRKRSGIWRAVSSAGRWRCGAEPSGSRMRCRRHRPSPRGFASCHRGSTSPIGLACPRPPTWSGRSVIVSSGRGGRFISGRSQSHGVCALAWVWCGNRCSRPGPGSPGSFHRRERVAGACWRLTAATSYAPLAGRCEHIDSSAALADRPAARSSTSGP